MQTKQVKNPIWNKVQKTEENSPKESLIRKEFNKYVKSKYKNSNINHRDKTEMNEIFKCKRKKK